MSKKFEHTTARGTRLSVTIEGRIAIITDGKALTARVDLLARPIDGGWEKHGDGATVSGVVGGRKITVGLDATMRGKLEEWTSEAKAASQNSPEFAERNAKERLSNLHKARRAELKKALGDAFGLSIEIDGSGALSVPNSGDINMIKFETALDKALTDSGIDRGSQWTPAPKTRIEVGEWGEGNKHIAPTAEDWDKAGR